MFIIINNKCISLHVTLVLVIFSNNNLYKKNDMLFIFKCILCIICEIYI